MRLGRTLLVITAAALLTVFVPTAAWADPPPALSFSAEPGDERYMPAFDYDTNGCYPSVAIGRDGRINDGLNNSGALNGECRDQSDLDNSNTYSRSRCNNGWCVYMYNLYFEKDQAVAGVDCCGHRHDIEAVAVWVQNDQPQYVSVSCHGDYVTHPASEVAFTGSHARIVYHKDGASTHCFRLAGRDEQPENHYQAWHSPTLVSWNAWPSDPAGLRDELMSHDFGSASFSIRDSAFADSLNEALPSGISFDPYGV